MSEGYNIYILVLHVLNPEDDPTGSKYVGLIYKYCKCCNVKTLEYIAMVGQILCK
jgi:hypothetical protein